FQIDGLIIQEAQIYLLEMKYFQGDYYYQDDNLYAIKSRKRMKNPFYQNQRCEDLLRDFLLQHKLHYNINSYIIFNHPSFMLYQAPIQSNIIFPTQIDIGLDWGTQKEKVLTQTIYREHIEKNPFEKLPSYHFEGLKKGIFCLKC